MSRREECDPFAEELKTYIPGVGFLVTNLSTAESHIFPVADEVEFVKDCESLVDNS